MFTTDSREIELTEIKHTLISWDCSFRNFFHLIDAFGSQHYDREKCELIYVEQRERKVADEYNHRLGLKSLHDRLQDTQKGIQLKAVYLEEPVEVPYHLGRCVNKGLSLARGKIISVMDGDLLLPDDFLQRLEGYHDSGAGVVNIVRRMALKPVGASYDRWMDGIIDFKRCLQVCNGVDAAIPRTTDNKGPMISAHRSAWKAIDGYDIHDIWSTGLSRLGQDVTARLEMFCKVDSTTLPETVCVHPYHPQGFSRLTLDSVRILAIQAGLIDWARRNKSVSWKDRTQHTNKIYEKKKRFIKRLHASTLSAPGKKKNSQGFQVGQSILLGKIYGLCRKILNGKLFLNA